ncbi:MAG: gamma-glutamyltransferase, partial [Acidobacteriota bacterium]
MHRRTFLATLPMAAAGSSALMKEDVSRAETGQKQTSAGPEELPKYQPAGAERFVRPDVHAGDRPAGASFASRSAALGCSAAAGTAHPLATQTAIAMLKKGG